MTDTPTSTATTGLPALPGLHWPPTAADLPKVTPELLASVLARYSRSNQGIGAILSKVDLANPDASIDRILNFVDYGHASIGGLTGGLAVALLGAGVAAVGAGGAANGRKEQAVRRGVVHPQLGAGGVGGLLLGAVLGIQVHHVAPQEVATLEGGHGMGDLYFFARKVAALGFSALREAVLVPKLPEAGANVSFWEVTAKNHGLTVQLFDDRQAAMAWLVGGGA